MSDDLTPRDDAGPRVAGRERVAAVERDPTADPLPFRGRLRDHAGRSLFASIEAFYAVGGMDRAVEPIMDFWERRGLPGRLLPYVHGLQRPLVTICGAPPAPRIGDFQRVWVCPEEYAIDLMHHLRAVAGIDRRARKYWQANMSRIRHVDVDADGSDVELSVVAYGVSSLAATWSFRPDGAMITTEPDPGVVAVGDAILGDSHTPHRAIEPGLDDGRYFQQFFRPPAAGG